MLYTTTYRPNTPGQHNPSAPYPEFAFCCIFLLYHYFYLARNTYYVHITGSSLFPPAPHWALIPSSQHT